MNTKMLLRNPSEKDDNGRKPTMWTNVKHLQMAVMGLGALCFLLFAFPRCHQNNSYEVGLAYTQVRQGQQQGVGSAALRTETSNNKQWEREEMKEEEEEQEQEQEYQKEVEQASQQTPILSNTKEISYDEDIPAIDRRAQVFMGHKSTNTGWIVDTRCFKKHNGQPLIGYGVGAGEDISWDIGMSTNYGFDMFVFDPTEKSIKYATPLIAQHSDHMTFTPEGMAAKQGTITFTLPKNKNHVSMRAGVHTKNEDKVVVLPVNTLRNWMDKYGHTYLDVLKIDIEGSEYEVLEQLIEEDYFPFTQLLVEFHQRWFGGDKNPRHQRVIQGLKNAGFVPFAKRHGNQEISFIKKKDLRYCVFGDYERKP